MMTQLELFDEIIQNLDADEIPLEFISMAKITDFVGREKIVRGEELGRIMRGPERSKISEARVIFDVRKIRMALAAEINAVYDEINLRALARATEMNNTEK